MRRLLALLLLSLPMAAFATIPPLLPKPQMASFTNKWTSADIPVVERTVGRVNMADTQEEAYHLRVYKDSVVIEATTARGIYWAQQTLRQLQTIRGGKTRLPLCEITDWPAFRIRGFMHDTGRSFIPVAELMEEIELLSRFKINTFHWHLTENQAWRLESKRYPQLNRPENMERDRGQYYTHEEARQLVSWCRKHGMMLIPEIDMPGHSAAFERTFGCSMQTEEGMRILKDIVAEACDVFDTPYLHIGTDEVRFTNPRFVPEMVAFVRSKGKKVISWNPGWQYKPGEIDMTQLWSYRGRAQEGIPAIDCRYHYANHFDTYADLVALYNSRIGDLPTGTDGMAGCIVAFWNDRYIDNTPQLLSDNNFYPYLLTLAERGWRGGGNCYFNGKGTLLWDDEPAQFDDFAEFESRLLYHKSHTLKDEPFPYERQTRTHWRITDAFPNDGDLARQFPPEFSDDTVYHYRDSIYHSRTITGNGVYLRHVWGTLVPGFYAHPQENHTAYATTYIHSAIDQEAKLTLEFQNYSRSESDLPPRRATWDYKHSQAWLNGIEIPPPTWQNTHTARSNEVALRNENATARPAIAITLRKGWNRLLLKLPVGTFTTPETRLVKWAFTAAISVSDESTIYTSATPPKIYN